MSAKEIEMAYLAKQNAEYKKMYEEMRSKVLLEESEVKVYNRLITPEMNRISRYDKWNLGWRLFITFHFEAVTASSLAMEKWQAPGALSSSLTIVMVRWMAAAALMRSHRSQSRCLRQWQRLPQLRKSQLQQQRKIDNLNFVSSSFNVKISCCTISFKIKIDCTNVLNLQV